MVDFMKNYELKLTVLSPVHIGCGEDYDPTGYVIAKKISKEDVSAISYDFICPKCRRKFTDEDYDEGYCECGHQIKNPPPKGYVEKKPEDQKDEYYLHEFDAMKFVSSLPESEKKEFSKIVDKNNLIEIQKFFYDRRDAISKNRDCSIKASYGVIDTYNSKIVAYSNIERNNSKVKNSLEIERTFYNKNTFLPIIPGSSLKGAIRTALLNFNKSIISEIKYQVDNANRLNKRVSKSLDSELQKSLGYMGVSDLKNGNKDRLANLNISDVISQSNIKRSVCYQVNRKKRATKDGKKEGQANIGVFIETLMQGDFLSDVAIKINNDHHDISINEVMNVCNSFYKKLFDKERLVLENNCYVSKEFFNKVDTFIKNKTGFLLRIGKHSGAEAITVEGYRNIKIMGKKNEGKNEISYRDNTTTLWLAADKKEQMTNLLPFGWVFIEVKEK